MAIDESAANVWLARRLPLWFERDEETWPRDVQRLGVHFGDDRVLLGAQTAGDGRILAVALTARIDDGEIVVGVESVRVNQLALPASVASGGILSWLADTFVRDPQALRGLREAIETGRVPRRPELELDDGRVVRVHAVDVEPGRLLLTCRTHSARERTSIREDAALRTARE